MNFLPISSLFNRVARVAGILLLGFDGLVAAEDSAATQPPAPAKPPVQEGLKEALGAIPSQMLRTKLAAEFARELALAYHAEEAQNVLDLLPNGSCDRVVVRAWLAGARLRGDRTDARAKEIMDDVMRYAKRMAPRRRDESYSAAITAVALLDGLKEARAMIDVMAYPEWFYEGLGAWWTAHYALEEDLPTKEILRESNNSFQGRDVVGPELLALTSSLIAVMEAGKKAEKLSDEDLDEIMARIVELWTLSKAATILQQIEMAGALGRMGRSDKGREYLDASVAVIGSLQPINDLRYQLLPSLAKAAKPYGDQDGFRKVVKDALGDLDSVHLSKRIRSAHWCAQAATTVGDWETAVEALEAGRQAAEDRGKNGDVALHRALTRYLQALVPSLTREIPVEKLQGIVTKLSP